MIDDPSWLTVDWSREQCMLSLALSTRLAISKNAFKSCLDPFEPPTATEFLVGYFPITTSNIKTTNNIFENNVGVASIVTARDQNLTDVITGENKLYVLDVNTKFLLFMGKINSYTYYSDTDVSVSFNLVRPDINYNIFMTKFVSIR